ncbi:MAG: flagellin [Bryobacteraceae bacterium]
MSFTINTNVASLQAQNYLRANSDFQSKTINRVTSGLRIVTSGDDAAGLAIANSYRSDEAVLTQGVRNANDGLSQLQIADGGINNISQLLDRARTLATQSSSGAFTGDRSVLNSEFQSVIGEIDRQAQAIGLDQGGTFAKSLNVFIGGGKESNGVTATTNGSITIDLSKSTVDSQSLGLKGVRASGASGSDIGVGSSTSVQNIITNSTNLASISNNTTDFYFTGPGFSDTYGSNVVKVSVNLTGVTDSGTLATAVNKSIQNAGNGASQQATAFKNANITAAINTDVNGKQQLTFNSASTAFQVQGGDRVSTALLANFSSGSTGAVANVTAEAAAAFSAPTGAETVNLRILGAGLTGTQGDISVAVATTDTADLAVATINTAIAGNTALAATGIAAVNNGGTIQLVGRGGQSFEVLTAGDVENALGFGTFANDQGVAGGAGAFDYNTISAAGASGADTQHLEISINGAAKIDLGVLTATGTEAEDITTLNAAFQANAATRAAGLVASDDGAGNITISSSGANFRLNFFGGSGDAFGFGDTSAAATVASTGSTGSAYAAKNSANSEGAQESENVNDSDVYQFTGLRNTGDAQTITLTAVDASGGEHTLNVGLTTSNASTLDQAVHTINAAILQSNDATLKQLAAFKEVNTGNTAEGVRFLSAGGAFKVSLGSSPSDVGIADGGLGTTGGAVHASESNGDGSTADISNITTAQAAVAALAVSVSNLGKAQAVVGRGQNQFNYAINLASSQLTNLAAAESRIRDADLASESANLTKAQILLQAGIAALAQANSAPQQVLTLLRG